MSKFIEQSKVILSKAKYSNVDSGVQELIDRIDLENDADGDFENMVISHLDIFNQSMNSSLKEYVNACNFVTHYYTDQNQGNAWRVTFPERAIKLQEKYGEAYDLKVTSRASMYFKTDLVQKILRQSAVGLGVMYSAYSHKAVQKLYNLMENSRSDRIQMESADKLLGHLKEVGKKSQLDVNVNVTHKQDFVGDIQDAMSQMITKQKAMISAGMDLKQVANARIGSEPELIEVELDDGSCS